MYHGGTNFDFKASGNGGNNYQPTLTSYDYDAPINEAGDLTDKYYAIQKLIKQVSCSIHLKQSVSFTVFVFCVFSASTYRIQSMIEM